MAKPSKDTSSLSGAGSRLSREREELATAARFQRSGYTEEAERIYADILNRNPRSFESLNGLAGLYAQRRQLPEAIALFKQGLRKILDKQQRTAVCSNLALMLAQPSQGRNEDALKYCEQALAISPAHLDAWINKGNILKLLNRPADAIECYKRVLKQRPDDVNVLWNKGLCHLLLGEYEDGWKLYESRWQGFQKPFLRHFSAPAWRGEQSLAGKTILLHAEQGYGDTLQTIRYIPMIHAQGARIVLEVPAALAALLSQLEGVSQLVAHGNPLPDFDYQCPLLSLPLACGTTLKTIPARAFWLRCDTEKAAHWRNALGQATGPRIGLAWSGNASHPNDINRSIPLTQLKELLDLPCEFHCLQKDIKDADRAVLRELTQLHLHEDALRDFSDTAALIDAMDIVIAVDTATLHLAGALGKTAWALLPYAPDYRWMLGRADTPWYPMMRLFRQQSHGDWRAALLQVIAALGSIGQNQIAIFPGH